MRPLRGERWVGGHAALGLGWEWSKIPPLLPLFPSRQTAAIVPSCVPPPAPPALLTARSCRAYSRDAEGSWFRSLFVHKVDPRKDAHSNLLSKKETSNLYKIQCEWPQRQGVHTPPRPLQLDNTAARPAPCCDIAYCPLSPAVHNVKPECLDAYNSLT